MTADIEVLQKRGQPSDTANLKRLQKRLEWLLCRRDTLEERRTRIISGFHRQLEAYMCQCEIFWKNKH